MIRMVATLIDTLVLTKDKGHLGQEEMYWLPAARRIFVIIKLETLCGKSEYFVSYNELFSPLLLSIA